MSPKQDYDENDHTDYAEIPMENDGNDTTVEDNGDEYEVIKYSCDMCAYENQSEVLVNIHKRHNNHSNVKYHCKKCSYSTSKREKLYKHNKTHVRHSCEDCGFATNRKEKLQSHLISHGEARSFQCKVCKKTYKHASTLTKHTNSHGVNYPCNKCNKKYTYQDQLKRHKALKHEEGHIKMHHCEYCAYKSFRADVLRNHMSAKHPHA